MTIYRPEISEGANCAGIWDSTLGREDTKYKGPEAGQCRLCSSKSKEAHLARVKGVREGKLGGEKGQPDSIGLSLKIIVTVWLLP
jgi:hypothetical protein